MTTDAEQHEAWLASRPTERVEVFIAFQVALKAIGAVNPTLLADATYAEAADCAIEDVDAPAEDKRDPIQGLRFALDVIRVQLDAINTALRVRSHGTSVEESGPEPPS